MIRIVICDDHPLIIEGIESFIATQHEMCVAGKATSARELRAILQQTTADVLLLDINLPDGNGIELCAEVKQQYPMLSILGLSNFDERSLILRMLGGGAAGYLLKSAPTDELRKAILHISKGGVYLGQDAQRALNHQPALDTLEEIPPITPREKEVLGWLKYGLTSSQIAEKMCVSPLTVDTHRRNLMQKFNVGKTVNLLSKAEALGLLR